MRGLSRRLPKTRAVNLDILGRLMACSSQLDMYMNSHDAMKWYTREFLASSYSFSVGNPQASADPATPP